MARGIALTIGLNSVDPNHYAGWSGDLNACEADAEDMASIANAQKFQTETLLTKDATIQKVTEKIRNASKGLQSGDIFLLSYSGHGGQLPDLNNDEPDSNDETWCLYDGELVDDQLYSLLGEFSDNVRILVFSDSCHSGTVIKVAYFSDKIDMVNTNIDSTGRRFRFLPTGVALRTYRKNRNFYDSVLKDENLKNSADTVKASGMLISGCQDNQLSLDGAFNGLFTSQVLKVWKDGSFDGDYHNFHKEILNRMPQTQSPNLFMIGQKNPNFESQKPFSI